MYEHQGKFYDPLLGQFIQPPEPTTLPTAAAHSITPDALAMTDQARETPSQFEYLLGETWANKVAGKIVDEVVERIFPEEIFVQVPPHPSTIESFRLRGLEPPDGEWLSCNNPLRSNFMNQAYGVGVDIGWQLIADLGTEMPLEERLVRAVVGSGLGGYFGGQTTKYIAIALGIANPGFGVSLISGYLLEPILGDIFMNFYYNARGYSDIE